MHSSGKHIPEFKNLVENIIDKSKGGKIISVHFDGKYATIKLKLWAWSSALIISFDNFIGTLKVVVYNTYLLFLKLGLFFLRRLF